MSIGSQGAEVRCLEERLGAITSNGLPFIVDEMFGADTEAAVRQFQTVAGLAVDGGVGPQTATALGVWSPPPPPPPPPPDIQSAVDNCTPGYDPCLPPASDYDCAGGSGVGCED